MEFGMNTRPRAASPRGGSPLSGWDRARRFAAVALLDRPWSRKRSRVTPVFAFLLTGTLAGTFQGVAYNAWCIADSWFHGDAFAWDTVEFFSWIGSAIGLSVGLAMAASRHLAVRLSLSTPLAVIAVYAAILLYGGGRPVYLWCSTYVEYDPAYWTKPLGWALWMGVSGAAVMAVTGHCLRRFGNKVKLQSLSLVVWTLLSMRLQSFAPESRFDLYPYARPQLHCMGDWSATGMPLGIGAAIAVLCTGTIFLYGNLGAWGFLRLGRPRWIPASVLALTALSFSGLAWASEAMPLTPASPIKNFAFTSDPERFFTAHEGETLRLWELRKLKCEDAPIAALRETFRLRHGPVRYLAFALCPTIAAAGSEDGWISLWELPSVRLLKEFKTPANRISELSISQDGKILAGGSYGAKIYLWRLRRDSPEGEMEAESLSVLSSVDNEHYYSFCLSEGGQRIAAFLGPSCVRVHDSRTGKMAFSRSGASLRMHDLLPPVLSPDGRFLATRSKDGSLVIDDLNQHRSRSIPQAGTPLRFSPDGRLLTASNGESYRFVEVETGRILKTRARTPEDVFLGFSPDGRGILIHSEDGTIEVYERLPK